MFSLNAYPNVPPEVIKKLIKEKGASWHGPPIERLPAFYRPDEQFSEKKDEKPEV